MSELSGQEIKRVTQRRAAIDVWLGLGLGWSVRRPKHMKGKRRCREEEVGQAEIVKIKNKFESVNLEKIAVDLNVFKWRVELLPTALVSACGMFRSTARLDVAQPAKGLCSSSKQKQIAADVGIEEGKKQLRVKNYHNNNNQNNNKKNKNNHETRITI